MIIMRSTTDYWYQTDRLRLRFDWLPCPEQSSSIESSPRPKASIYELLLNHTACNFRKLIGRIWFHYIEHGRGGWKKRLTMSTSNAVNVIARLPQIMVRLYRVWLYLHVRLWRCGVVWQCTFHSIMSKGFQAGDRCQFAAVLTDARVTSSQSHCQSVTSVTHWIIHTVSRNLSGQAVATYVLF